VRRQAGSRTGWQPDPRVSLALAGCASLLVTAAFIALLHAPAQWQQSVARDQLRERLLLQSSLPRSTAPKPHLPVLTPAPTALPVLSNERLRLHELVPVSIPAGDTLQGYL